MDVLEIKKRVNAFQSGLLDQARLNTAIGIPHSTYSGEYAMFLVAANYLCRGDIEEVKFLVNCLWALFRCDLTTPEQILQDSALVQVLESAKENIRKRIDRDELSRAKTKGIQ